MNKIKKIIQNVLTADDKIKKLLFGIILTGLSCTIWHNYINIFNIEELIGYEEPSATVSLNMVNWFSAEYQQKTESNIVLSNLLSPFFVRVNNQINFNLFRASCATDVIVGQDGYLYNDGYIRSHSGEDYIGEEKLREYVQKMKFVQDTLTKLNKEFIYIQAPGKACYFPETLPKGYSHKEAALTNYNCFNRLLSEFNINHIDFKPYILKNKSTTVYPLFTRTGIHWSRYATCLVIDSINNYIETLAKIDLPDVYWDEIVIDYPKYEDADLERLMNLLFRISYDKYAYPKLKFEPHTNKDIPVVLMIGDSYLGNLYWGSFFESFDPKSQFWFYNKYPCSSLFHHKLYKYQLNQIDVLGRSEIVILGCNEPNIRSTSWEFINDLYDYYSSGNRIAEARNAYMLRVDSCKLTLSDSDIEKVKSISQKQKISIDSARTVLCMSKLDV